MNRDFAMFRIKQLRLAIFSYALFWDADLEIQLRNDTPTLTSRVISESETVGIFSYGLFILFRVSFPEKDIAERGNNLWQCKLIGKDYLTMKLRRNITLNYSSG